jgi:glutamate-1-semialdehyde 2,1-aminomutase
LIFDEVVTGCRFAYGGAQEYYGVVPDLAALGQIIGGGYPLAAVVGKAEIMEHFVRPDADGLSVAQVGTLNGNPIAATAGLATLHELQQSGVYERLRALGQQLRSLLEATLHEHRVPGQVLGDGPLFHVLFTDRPVCTYRDTLAADASKHRLFHQQLLHHGVLKSPSKGYISLVHSEADITATAKAFDAAMAQVARTT